MKVFQNHNVIVGAFFVAYFILGVCIVRDYGLSWDEPYVRQAGKTAYRYITRQSNAFERFVDRDYGTAFELPLVAIEKWLAITSPQQVYYVRHFLTFLLFFTGTVFFYLLAYERFKQWGLALLGVFFLLLSPRIFSDSFYNSKDIGLLSCFIIAVCTLTYFLKNPTWKRALLHGVVSAFVVDIRLSGLTIVALTIGFWLLDTFFSRPRRGFWLFRITGLLAYMVSLLIFVIAFWPYLWSDPPGHFFHALSVMGNYVFGLRTVLYFGQQISVTALPWHYPLVWIVMTTPIIFTIFFLIGMGVVMKRSVKNFAYSYARHRIDLLFFAWFTAPVLAVIVLHTPIYDGWRHLYFVYPAFILVGLIGLENIWHWGKTNRNQLLARGVIASLIIVNLVSVVFFMVRYHPYQHLYFNELAGNMTWAKRNFVLDYWGLTFRSGLEFIAAHDPRREITVYLDQGNEDTIHILPDKDRVRFIPLKTPREADYIITNYPDGSSGDVEVQVGFTDIYHVIIDETKIMTVFEALST